MEGRQERAEPLDRAHDLSSLSGEVEAVARGDRSMQQCRPAPPRPYWRRLLANESGGCALWCATETRSSAARSMICSAPRAPRCS